MVHRLDFDLGHRLAAATDGGGFGENGFCDRPIQGFDSVCVLFVTSASAASVWFFRK